MSEDIKDTVRDIEEMIQVVLIAIPREIRAQEFYLSAARKAISDNSRELFESLARQERGHEAELRRILNDLKRQLERFKKD
jgi:rubrerythrin